MVLNFESVNEILKCDHSVRSCAVMTMLYVDWLADEVLICGHFNYQLHLLVMLLVQSRSRFLSLFSFSNEFVYLPKCCSA